MSSFGDIVERHRVLLRKRGFALADEHVPPVGQAALWFADAFDHMPRTGREVARQIARLCGDDSHVVVSWRSLADAVGMRDKRYRTMAPTERGVEVLVKAGWLRVETTGRGRGARTRWQLLPGNRDRWSARVDDDPAEELAA